MFTSVAEVMHPHHSNEPIAHCITDRGFDGIMVLNWQGWNCGSLVLAWQHYICVIHTSCCCSVLKRTYTIAVQETWPLLLFMDQRPACTDFGMIFALRYGWDQKVHTPTETCGQC